MVSNVPATRHPVTIVIAATLFASAGVYSSLPAVAGRGLIAFALPGAAAVTFALLQSLWRHDAVRRADEHAEATYQSIVAWIVLFPIALHAVILAGLLFGREANVVRTVPFLPRAVPILLGITLIGIGNLLPRIGPNLVVGIRTRESLNDRRVWSRTQRAAGYVAVGLGAAVAVIGLLIPPGRLLLPLLSGAALLGTVALVASVRKSSHG